MEPFILRTSQILPAPLKEVFAFFRDPSNLARITPAELGFRILTPQPLQMREGAVIDYTIRTLGVPMRWTTIITDYDPPNGFSDLQLKGPYAYWHHSHAFRAVDGGTEMTDTVRYLLRGGPVGTLVHRLFVRRQLDKIFSHRAEVISAMFPARGEGARRPAPAGKRSVKKGVAAKTGVTKTGATKSAAKKTGAIQRRIGKGRAKKRRPAKSTSRKPAGRRRIGRRGRRKAS